MASSSKPKKDPTPEEIMARKRMITGGQHAGNLLDMAPGTEIMMNADGSNGFRINDSGDPSSIFKWNEKTGDYRSDGGGIARIAKIPQQSVAPAPSGGGGGGTKPPTDWRKQVRPTEQPTDIDGATEQDIMGNTYDNMVNWTPISSDGQGGTQHINPLVDPLSWMYQPNPAHQVAFNDPGVYVNPQVGMLQNSWSKTSSNPYSLLG